MPRKLKRKKTTLIRRLFCRQLGLRCGERRLPHQGPCHLHRSNNRKNERGNKESCIFSNCTPNSNENSKPGELRAGPTDEWHRIRPPSSLCCRFNKNRPSSWKRDSTAPLFQDRRFEFPPRFLRVAFNSYACQLIRLAS